MKKMKKIVAGLLAAALTIGALTGCSAPKLSDEEYAAKVAATYGTQEIKLSEVNYYLRSVQYTYEAYYSAFYGEDMWDLVVSGSKTMEDSVKETVLSEIYQIYVLNAKAAELGITLSDEDLEKVEKAVDEYLEDAPETVLEEVRLGREELVEIYKRNAIANRAWEYAVKDTDIEVSDDEAAQRKVTVITLSDSSKDYKSEEMKDEILKALKDGDTMEEIAKDKKLTATPYTLGEGDYESSIGPTAMKLKKGESEAVYLKDYAAWYVIYCDNEFDEEATKEEKELIVAERQAAEFEKIYKEWKESAEAFEVDDDAVDFLTFGELLYVPETSEETSEEESSEEETTEEGSSEETSSEETTEAETK